MTTIMTSTVMFTIMDEFIVRALVAGLLVALICAPLGCLVVWQRMAYFGAALSHAALLGVVLGLLLEFNPRLSILLVCLIIVLLVLFLERYRGLSGDTVLGILAHSSLAFGIIAVSMLPTLRLDLMAYLFGDILSVSWNDIVWIAGGGIVIAIIVSQLWRPLLSVIIHHDLAFVDGHRGSRLRLVFLLLIGVAVAVSMQVVGLLLVVSLLIIPVASARPFSTSPETMVVGAALFGLASVCAGVWASLQWDTPAGPSIVAVATALFAGALLTAKLRGVRLQ